MAFTIFVIVVTCILITIALITIINTRVMLRLTLPESDINTEPHVSILIPARDEADGISKTIKLLLQQDYSNYEIVLLDDNSTDGTADIARQVANDNPKFQVISGKPLPAGWSGKNWACHQLSETAKGDYLIFTDADVRWKPQALSAVISLAKQTQADLLTVWPTQRTDTWGERLIVPLMAFVTIGYLPHTAVNRSPSPSFAAANGQCMVFDRSSYEAIGGHKAVQNAIVEDIRLAQHIKSNRRQLRMADGNQLISCRMYSGWPEVKNGYAKNIIAGYGDSLLGLGAGTLFHWAVFLFPYFWLLYGLTTRNTISVTWAVALIGIGILIRALTAATTHQRVQDALLLPVSVVMMTIIAGQSVWWYVRYGGPRWKGRTLTRNTEEG